MLLRCLLTLVKKKLNGKSFLISHSRCVSGSATALNLIYGPAEAALLLIALELPPAKGVVMDWDGTKLSWWGGFLLLWDFASLSHRASLTKQHR